MIFLIKSFLLIYLYSFLVMHPVHVSVSNMEYLSDKNEIEYSIKIFKDDFQLLFYHLYEKNIDFNDTLDINRNMNMVNKYMNKCIILEINNEKKTQYIKSYDIKPDAIWFYYGVPLREQIESIKILNTVLLDLYFDQKNLLIFKSGKFEKGFQFDIKNKEHIIELK